VSRPHVLVVGCGAIGTLLAAHLAAVAQVSAFDIDAAQVAAIQAGGLRVEGVSALQARVGATDRVEALAGCRFDAIVFLVKSGATAAALRTLAPVLAEPGARPLLVTLQNGMGNAEALLTVPGLPVARGVSMDAARYLGPGRAAHLIRGRCTWLGPVRGALDDVRPFAALLQAAGLPCEAIADPMDAVWSKFVFNAVMNPLGALLLGVNAARYEVPEVRALVDDMAAECRAVVLALGGRFAFDPMEYVQQVRQGLLPVSAHAGSMALDIARGADTEIEELTGYIVREADRLGVPVPACRTVLRLCKGLEFAARLRHSIPTKTETTTP
jgi:2-dehydropantoate 2-reductase